MSCGWKCINYIYVGDIVDPPWHKPAKYRETEGTPKILIQISVNLLVSMR